MLTRILQVIGVGPEEITVYDKKWEQYRPLVYYANSVLAREEGNLSWESDRCSRTRRVT
ncbi:hypothetical protein [Methanopyrus kandleri]|uniref:Uncharacterized protein n=2 Tax=Methanopyrus kandleri TaxID=2320 RepID=Q8TWP7_METKA|nr:hypothetical protein [Methanopyrus kandleri]AAM02198.1 Uncharacterized protein MK0985 [Methanopyrus kandleri AV19]HII69611.1 hypothetical protein [Methanopyrus kandleri]